MAYGLGFKPWEFEQLQPQELYRYLKGQQEFQKRKDYRTAYWISWLLSPYVKEPLSVEKMVTPLWSTPEKEMSKLLKDKKIIMKEFGIQEEVKK